VLATGNHPAPKAHAFIFVPQNEFVPLRTRRGRHGLLLFMVQDYVVERAAGVHGGFEARVTAYRYRVLDSDEREILAYHWHPTGISPIAFPHLHLSGRLRPLDFGSNTDPIALGEMHLPTGYVALEDIVRLLITEFDVQPRRDDWETILRENLTG
jgi:hypothetical protein